MKAVMLTDIRQMETRELPDPVIVNDNDVLLKIEYVGVCGSDVHYYETGRIGSQIVQYPFTVGHECTATVVRVGSSVTDLKEGDPVVVEPAISCWQCDQCKAGRPHTCRQQKFLGCPGQIDGCLSEYIIMPAECCFPTKDQITLQQGALCEPFAIGVYAVQQSELSEKPNSEIAILGSGPIGLSCLVAAKTEGVSNVYMTDRIDARVEVALSAGASWADNPDKQDVVGEILKNQPMGVDVVFECAGQQDTIDQAVELLTPGGTLMLIGIPRQDRISLSPDQIRRKEISIINVRRQNHCTQKAMDLVAQGKADVDFIMTHHFNFDQTQQAFDLVADYSDGVVKALIKVSQ